jgi:hypothetical protein
MDDRSRKAKPKAIPKTQVIGWCDAHGHETITCTACGAQWCPEPGHGRNCGKPVAKC